MVENSDGNGARTNNNGPYIIKNNRDTEPTIMRRWAVGGSI